MKRKRIEYLIESAKRTKTMDFEWTAEVCYWLLRSGKTDEGVRAKVVEIVEEVEKEFRRKVDVWRVEGFDYETELWPLYERLLAAVELLAQRPDKVAAQRLCDVLKKMKLEAEEVAIKHLFGS